MKIGRVVGIMSFVVAMVLLSAGAAQAFVCAYCGGNHVVCNNQQAKDLIRQIAEIEAQTNSLNQSWDEPVYGANNRYLGTIKDIAPAAYQKWLEVWLQWQDLKQQLQNLRNANIGSGGTGGGGTGGTGGSGGGGGTGGSGGTGGTGGSGGGGGTSPGSDPNNPAGGYGTGDPGLENFLQGGGRSLLDNAIKSGDYSSVGQKIGEVLSKMIPGSAAYMKMKDLADKIDAYLRDRGSHAEEKAIKIGTEIIREIDKIKADLSSGYKSGLNLNLSLVPEASAGEFTQSNKAAPQLNTTVKMSREANGQVVITKRDGSTRPATEAETKEYAKGHAGKPFDNASGNQVLTDPPNPNPENLPRVRDWTDAQRKAAEDAVKTQQPKKRTDIGIPVPSPSTATPELTWWQKLKQKLDEARRKAPAAR